ncbi:MAG: phospholipase A [Ectothiorhodospiraceae bacterium]|nr:phospholipase A [Ectothiorhodospiraceae bacterium]
MARAFLYCLVCVLLFPAPGLGANDQETEREEVAEETGSDGLPATMREAHLAGQEPALTVHEPMYFVAGGGRGDDVKARFQLSLKYRLFDRESNVVEAMPWTSNLHFAYTQTALWNWSEDSAPFEDSSYRPSLFWQFGRLFGQDRAGLMLVGYEHESNGQGGDDSRSIDTLFITPGWAGQAFGREIIFLPKLYAYINKGSENPDIQRYRGYADFIVRYGNDDSWVTQLMYRRGTGGNNTVQVDLSIPVRPRIFARTGAYIYFQAFEGYGESLLGYDQRTGLSLRVGFAVVR